MRQIQRCLGPFQHLPIAAQFGCGFACLRFQVFESETDGVRPFIGRLPEWRIGTAIQQRVDLGFAGVPLAPHLDHASLDYGELCLGFEDVLLRRLAHGVTRFRHAEQVAKQIAVAFQDTLHLIRMVQAVISLLQPGNDIQLHGAVFFGLRVRLPPRDVAPQPELARPWELLRRHDADVGGGLCPQPRAW